MHRFILILLVFFGVEAFAASAPLYTFRDLASGYIKCPDTLHVAPVSKKTLFCEASAAVYSKELSGLYIASDWRIREPLNALFYSDYPSGNASSPVGQPLTSTIKNNRIKKIEGLTKTSDGKIIIGTTAFTHSPEVDSYWEPINKVFYWPSGEHLNIRFPDLLVNGNRVKSSELSSEEYSGYIRKTMLEAIQRKYPEAAFFKIEGLTTLPNNKLAFGVREIGKSFKSSVYKAIILTTSFSMEDEVMVMDTDFRMEYDFEIRKKFQLRQEIGLSSLEYDHQRNRLYIMTSYEAGKRDEDLGAYLWISTMNKDTGQLARPKAVVDKNLKYFHFAHKGEGLAIDPEGNIILIADDDKVLGRNENEIQDVTNQFSRKHYEAAYKILRITPRKLKSAIPH